MPLASTLPSPTIERIVKAKHIIFNKLFLWLVVRNLNQVIDGK